MFLLNSHNQHSYFRTKALCRLKIIIYCSGWIPEIFQNFLDGYKDIIIGLSTPGTYVCGTRITHQPGGCLYSSTKFPRKVSRDGTIICTTVSAGTTILEIAACRTLTADDCEKIRERKFFKYRESNSVHLFSLSLFSFFLSFSPISIYL